MREIKFRAWDKINKRMWEHEEINIWDRFMRDDMSHQYEIMQYTGLKDKNGTEIYEGDILKCLDFNDEEYVTDVKFDGGAFLIEVNGCDYDYTAIGWAIGQDIDECDVIGNIYENPELLK